MMEVRTLNLDLMACTCIFFIFEYWFLLKMTGHNNNNGYDNNRPASVKPNLKTILKKC